MFNASNCIFSYKISCVNFKKGLMDCYLACKRLLIQILCTGLVVATTITKRKMRVEKYAEVSSKSAMAFKIFLIIMKF